MKAMIIAAALALTACATQNQCVQPDPVQPASKAWNKGINGGEAITPYNK